MIVNINYYLKDLMLMVSFDNIYLKDISTMKYGKMPKKDKITEDETKYPIFSGYKIVGYYDEYNTKKDTLIVVARGVGGTGDVKLVPEDCYLTNLSIAVLFDDNRALNRYLYYYFQMHNLRYLDSGSAQSQITINDLKLVKIPLPSIEIQNKIINILRTIDDKIEINKKINHNLELIAENIFKTWFVDCEPFDSEKFKETSWSRVPIKWKEVELNDLINITSGKRPKEKLDVYTHEFKYPLFGASSIMAYVKEFLFDEKIIIIGRVGTHGVVQRVNCKSYPSDNTLVIKSDFYNYVYQILKRIDYDSLNIGSTQPLLTQKSIKKVEVILPPKEWLIKYEKVCNVLFSEIEKNKTEMIKLNNLRDILLPKLMSGEIDVSKIEI